MMWFVAVLTLFLAVLYTKTKRYSVSRTHHGLRDDKQEENINAVRVHSLSGKSVTLQHRAESLAKSFDKSRVHYDRIFSGRKRIRSNR